MNNRLAHINLAHGYRGGERQTELLIRGLAAEGWQQKLVARRREPLAERCAGIDGLEVIAVPARIIAATRALDHADLVHVHEGRSLQAAVVNYWLCKIPYLITRRVQKGPTHSVFNRHAYRQAAGIVTLSGAINQSINALAPGLRCITIPSASSVLVADPVQSKVIRKLCGDGFIVGHIGALDDSAKGQMQIIAVARRMLESAPRVSFMLVGSGKDDQLLRESAADLPNVYFSGQVENVADYLEAFDMFLFPSRHEGLGSILLDALAFGLPIVATRVGGIPDIVADGRNGFLCAVDDIQALSEAILRIFQNAELYAQISRFNQENAQQYLPGKMTQRYMEVYRELISAAGPVA